MRGGTKADGEKVEEKRGKEVNERRTEPEGIDGG